MERLVPRKCLRSVKGEAERLLVSRSDLDRPFRSANHGADRRRPRRFERYPVYVFRCFALVDDLDHEGMTEGHGLADDKWSVAVEPEFLTGEDLDL